jgi:hypothetical protein
MNKRLCLTIFVFLLIFSFIPQPSHAWLSGFLYRKPITINNTQNTNTLTNYQVPINITYVSGKMNADFSDLRFTNATDFLLPYWIESKVNSQWAYVWVKVDTIPASSTKTIYVYYGNPSATSLSNGDNTFDFFDDFLGTALNTSKWTVYTGTEYSVSGGLLTITNQRVYIGANKNFQATSSTLGYAERALWKINTLPTSQTGMNWRRTHDTSSSYIIYFLAGATESWEDWYVDYNGSGYEVAVNLGAWTANVWKKFEVGFTTGNSFIKEIPSGWNRNDPFGHAYAIYPVIGAYTTGLPGATYDANFDWFLVRKYTSPEPTYSTGAEESIPNQPPLITIFFPENTTYWYAYNFQFLFKVIDENSTTFHVKAYLDGGVFYNNASYLNNTNISIIQNLTQAKTYNFTVWANDTAVSNPQTAVQTVLFTIKDYQIEAIEYNAIVYETTDQNYTEKIRVNFDLISNITANLTWNNEDKGTANEEENSTHFIFTKQITLPLIQQNNTQYSFYFENNITYANGSSYIINSATNYQNLTYAYWIDSIASDKNDYIEFEDALITLYVKDEVGRATFTANITFVYNNTYNTSVFLDSYTTNSDLRIFSNTFDTLQSFSDNETRKYFANLTISSQNSSRIMNSAVQQLTVYKIILTNCSAGSISQTKALTFFVKDEETDGPIQNATIEATFDVWKTGEIKRNYAWKFYLENTDNQSICIYPSWATYTIDSMIQYYKTGYKDRTYFIFANISNATTGTNLYLLDLNTGDILIVYVRDENGNKVQDAIVKIQRYFVGNNSYKTVAQLKTDFEGKGVSFVRVNEIYYKFIIEKNFVVLRETQPTIITCISGGCPPYTLTLTISEQQPAKYFRYVGKIAYACQLNEETNILKCTVSDTSQLMQKSRLLVEKKGALKFDTLCDNTCESSACTLTCDLGNRTNKIYRYMLFAYFPKSPVVLEQNILDYLTGLISWGSQGLLLSFLIVATLFFVGIWNPVVSMVFAFLGIITGYLFGMIPVSISSLIGLGIALSILIYKMRV